MTQDALYRFTFDQLPVRGQWVRLENVLSEASAIREYPYHIHELLGQMLACVSMFADNLKFDGAVALQSKGTADIVRTLAECRQQKLLRGIVHLRDEAELDAHGSLREWLGNGQLALSLIPDDESLAQTTYQGLVELKYSTLTENLQHYFATSEQLPTQLFFGQQVSQTKQLKSITGLLLQRLPDADDATEVMLSQAEEAWHTLTMLAQTVSNDELATLSPADMLHRLFREYPCRIYPSRALTYECSCNKRKSDRTLATLGEQELQEILDELGQIDVDCEFCGARYSYDQIDVQQLLSSLSTPGSPPPPATPSVH